MQVYLLIGILFLEHDGKSLQEGPHARSHVQSHHTLLLQGSAAGRQYMTGCHELHGTVDNQNILKKKWNRSDCGTAV